MVQSGEVHAPGDSARAAPRRRTLFLLSQHQVAAVAATAIDYSIMILCVSLFGLSPVAGTVCGALCGAVTSFTLGRRWVFDAVAGDLRGQVLRYGMVSAISLCCNAGGEGLLVHAGLHYILARVAIAAVVGVAWNFPMHRYFVFRVGRAPAAPERPAEPVRARAAR